MKLIKRINLLGIFYASIFLVTQFVGLLVSIVICYIVQDFIWGFISMALVNSCILGLSLIGSCYLTQKFIFKLKVIFIVAITFSLVLGISIISFFVVFLMEPTLFIYYERGAVSFLVINFLFTIALYSISSGLIVYREIMAEKEKVISTERFLRNQMEMKLLSSRVNPHFLFNTLNMILTLVKQPEKAEIAILNLSDLLRENIEQSDNTYIPVKREIDNVRKYLELQKLRFCEKLSYEIKGDDDFSIPPLLIQPLVENCIKHNIQNVSFLTVEVVFFREADRNYISVIDSVKALHPSMLNQGQGLTVTMKRVENSNGIFLIKNGGIEISFSR